MIVLLVRGSFYLGDADSQLRTSAHTNRLAPLFAPEVLYWEPQILVWSQAMQLDPNLAATIMQIESCGDPLALSPSGAIGLFQVMPYHFIEGEDPFTPETNARRGLGYLRQAWDAAGGVPRLAFAGYNGGINGMQMPESAWPDETQRYTYWGQHIYQDARRGRSSSVVLDEWFASGGASLCQQARLRLGIAPEESGR
ncbi:MAG: lytic transglycosylase domain-containing protein [Anaerolineae bacterium]|nr:lytic transglycosylase domain-containing protein [Anaerolineae bacterium]